LNRFEKQEKTDVMETGLFLFGEILDGISWQFSEISFLITNDYW
jgi:hypothetical protein